MKYAFFVKVKTANEAELFGSLDYHGPFNIGVTYGIPIPPFSCDFQKYQGMCPTGISVADFVLCQDHITKVCYFYANISIEHYELYRNAIKIAMELQGKRNE